MTENKKNIELPEKLKNNSLAIELSELPNAINEMHELVAKKKMN